MTVAPPHLCGAALRDHLRSFLAEHHPGRPPRDPVERFAFQRGVARLLAEHGLAAPSWPRRWGGMELDLLDQLAYHEEIAAARIQPHPAPGAFTVGPTLILHGTDWQRERFLLPLLRADEIWCQGFSEPDAGSDLPSLRTRAVRHGEVYRVSGQKVWITQAGEADWMFALVRTGRQEQRQAGITYLLLDMHAPGITVQPIRDLTGGSSFSQVFLDDVAVPVTHRVGEENGGWSIARTSLGHERTTASVSSSVRYRRVVEELIAMAKENGAASDPEVARELVDLAIRARIVALNALRGLAAAVATGDPGPAASVNRSVLSLFEQRLHEVAIRVLGPDALFAADDPAAPQRGRWTFGFLRTRASTIGGGTIEIQRNTIAERVLRLPHDAAMPAAPAQEG